MVAKLLKEHLLVKVDSTHADRGLAGVFLGWHDTTPVAWMYSVRLQRVMRVQDTPQQLAPHSNGFSGLG
eukprot:3633661-Rhodomonas_salina.1